MTFSIFYVIIRTKLMEATKKERSMTEIILLVLEIIGTVAFSISGAFVAIKARLDIFGVIFIGCITSVGGGITRDILIGATPPAIFSRPYVLLIAALTSAVVFVIAYFTHEKFNDIRAHIEPINNVFDAVGLAAFSATGTEIAFTYGLSSNSLLSIVLGALTGVGGGMIRDVLTSTTPYIFKKHVYALASISGAALYYVLRYFCFAEAMVPSFIVIPLVILMRILATKYRWSLPKVGIKEKAATARKNNKNERKKAS